MWSKIKDFSVDILGKTNEAAESLEEALKDRLISPFYGYFIISWFLVNWNYVYAALFVDQNVIFQKFGLLRNEFLLQNILPSHYGLDWFFDFFFIPFILTVLAIWGMPLLTNLFYAQHLININRQEKTRLKALKRTTKQEAELIEEKVKKAQIEKRAEDINPEINWEGDFERFKKNKLYKKFHQITDSYYKYDGYLRYGEFSIDTDILIYADSHKLVKFSEDERNNRVLEPTEKGKYFFKEFVEDPDSVRGVESGEIDPDQIPF